MAAQSSIKPTVPQPSRSISPKTTEKSGIGMTAEIAEVIMQATRQTSDDAAVIMPPRPMGNGHDTSDGRPSTSSSAASGLNFFAEPYVPSAIASSPTEASDSRAPTPPDVRKKIRNSKSKNRRSKSAEASRPVSPATADFDPIHASLAGVISMGYESSSDGISDPHKAAINADGLAWAKSLGGLHMPSHYLRVLAPFGSDFFKERFDAQGGRSEEGLFHFTRASDAWHEHVRTGGHWIGPVVNGDGTTDALICSDSVGYAEELKTTFEQSGQVSVVDFITRASYARADKTVSSVPSPDARVLVSTILPDELAHMSAKHVADSLYQAIDNGINAHHLAASRNSDIGRYSSVRTFERLEAPHPNFVFHFELDKISDATFLVEISCKQQGRIEAFHPLYFAIVPYDSFSGNVDVNGRAPFSPYCTGGTAGLDHSAAPLTIANADDVGHMRQVSQNTFISQTGRSAVVVDVWGEVVPIPGHIQAGMVQRRSDSSTNNDGSPMDGEVGTTGAIAPVDVPEAATDGRPKMRRPSLTWSAQTVLIEKIRRGLDLRTTLMIRNTPTKWFAEDARRMLDITHAGQYDFTYARIDLRKMQAVGYVFVNFISAEALKTWVEHWVPENGPALHMPNITTKPPGEFNKYHKAVAVNYANIQGLECLEAKFRNSCMLEEVPQCRPRLWYSVLNADEKHPAGSPREWPAPDNNAKLQRSMENSLYQGLYAPRDRARDQGRRTQSRFDRGTTRHQRDEVSQGPPRRGQLALPAPNNAPAPWQMQQQGQQYIPENSPAPVGQYTGFQHQVPLPGRPHPMYNGHNGFNGVNNFNGYNGGPAQFPIGYGPQQMPQMPMNYPVPYNNGYMAPQPPAGYVAGPAMMYNAPPQPWVTNYNVLPPRAPVPGAMMRTQTGGRLGKHVNIVPDPKRDERFASSSKGKGKDNTKA
nr:hypothetical protein B0A51_10194 [Rachicladosporium sp. CCFEE 5018]